MKAFQIAVLKVLLAKLQLQKAKQEFGNSYVFGFDDVQIVIEHEIKELQNA